MDIVSKLDLAVNFKMGEFKIGQLEWGSMSYNNENVWEFPLVPNASAFAKLNEYCRGTRTRALVFLTTGADSENEFDAREVVK